MTDDRANLPATLRAELASRNPGRRRAACVELGQRLAVGEVDVIPVLVARLEDNHAAIRALAAAALAEGPPAVVAPAIIDRLAALPHPSPPGHRAAFLHALAELEPACTGRTRDVLVEHLGHPDGDVRFNAATALNRLGCSDDGYRSAALRLLDDPDAEVAAVAATALAELGETGVGHRVVERWRGARKFAARQLAIAAAHLGATEVLPSLREAIKQGIDALAAIEAVMALDPDPTARDLLRWAASAWRVHAVVRARAAVGLCELGDAQGPEIVERHLGSRRRDLRYATLEWMGRSGVVALHERLGRILSDGRNPDSAVAAYGLGFVPGHGARAWLEAAAQADPRPEVREEAQLALSGIAGGPEARDPVSRPEAGGPGSRSDGGSRAAGRLVHDL